MDGLKHYAHGLYKAAAEAVTGPLKTSQFDQKGVLTPQEFTAAGDYLVRACPTWLWEGGDARKRKSFLPADKQFLVTRSVPCDQRASELEHYNPNSEFPVAGEDGWVATHENVTQQGTGSSHNNHQTTGGPAQSAPKSADDEIPDISDLELSAADDEAAVGLAGTYLRAEEPDTIRRTRTYDLYITYDQYYQVPRMWLVGYDESRQPLTPQQVLEDVSEEHARKTITVDPHPHLPISAASIHPCRHAEVMKRLVSNLQAVGKEFPINHYLVLFLKFMASVVPTIQYDYTMSVGN